jgi:hypothetical protein
MGAPPNQVPFKESQAIPATQVLSGTALTIKKNNIVLPPGIATVGISETELARVWGISPTQLSELDQSYKPRARRVGKRKLYSYVEAQAKFHELPFWDEQDSNDEWRVS